jgi:hypothetical protein
MNKNLVSECFTDFGIVCNLAENVTRHRILCAIEYKNSDCMKRILTLFIAMSMYPVANCQEFSIVAGDTIALSGHRPINPPDHIERVGIGTPVVYNLDVNLDGFDDISIECGNSYAAMGYGSNYMTVTALDSNAVCYSHVDSSYCINGFKPLYFTRLFDLNDTINDLLAYTQNETIIDKELWFMGDTCHMLVENIGAKYIAVRLNSHGIEGLAWISLELFAKTINGYATDVNETGFKSIMSSTPEKSLLVSVYPNPSNGWINICLPRSALGLTTHVFDLIGNEVMTIVPYDMNSHIWLPKGSYILKVSRKWQIPVVEKIIIL